MSGGRFAERFALLTGNRPFPWQSDLYARMLSGRTPDACRIPTGMGKTSVIPIWFLASAERKGCAGRRLIYIVNRRTVVDQATEEVERLLKRLDGEAGLAGLRGERPAVSTLRGELADNGAWKADLSRLAIVVGTIDMIGSKLLFSGYGDGRSLRATHAGLIGQDTLIVHDEAHLTPAFGRMLREARAEQIRCREGRPIRVLELTATSREAGGEVLELSEEDRRHAVVGQRLAAKKALHLVSVEGKELQKEIEAKALGYDVDGVRVLVYVQTPGMAKGVAEGLKRKADGRVCLLTGTMRGKERDELVQHDVYRRFLPGGKAQDGQSVYLVSTSAGEVGINLDADHMVCDLTPLDSMIQRFGRVNRFGMRKAEVWVFDAPGKKESAYESARRKTAEILRDVEDVSPNGMARLLRKLGESPEAYSPKPRELPLSDVLLDSWSMTSIAGAMPGRGEVAYWLHGVEEEQAPEVVVAWREDVGRLLECGAEAEELAEYLEAYPVRSKERLRERAGAVREQFGEIAKRRSGARVLVQLADGEIADRAVEELAETVLPDGSMVVLPTELGGLEGGMLDGAAESASDVADAGAEMEQARILLQRSGDEWSARVMGSGRNAAGTDLEALFKELAPGMVWEWEFVERTEDAEPAWRTVYLRRPDKAEAGRSLAGAAERTVEEHSRDVEQEVREMLGRLGLDGKLANAVALAAKWHDRGKAAACWQRAIGNGDVARPLAKTGHGRFAWWICERYRHEFGSLLAAEAHEAIRRHPKRDLILHLIGAHHGWARPHFREGAPGPESPTRQSEQAMTEAMRRFARLQREYGRWGLAWLEAVVKSADAKVSAGGKS